MATNFVGKIDLHSTPCSSRDIRYGGAAGIRQEGQLLCVAQANELPDSMDAGEPINRPINNKLTGAEGDKRVGHRQALPCI